MGVVKEPILYTVRHWLFVGVYSRTYDVEEGEYFPSNPVRHYFYYLATKALGNDPTAPESFTRGIMWTRFKAALFLVHGGQRRTSSIEQAEFLIKQLDNRNYPYELI